ncbi:hypothetical protein KJ564_05050, partial [bacterium]|nr:hypothetical protein [bacterium]
SEAQSTKAIDRVVKSLHLTNEYKRAGISTCLCHCYSGYDGLNSHQPLPPSPYFINTILPDTVVGVVPDPDTSTLSRFIGRSVT